MIKVLAIDDEPLALQQMAAYAPPLVVFTTAYSEYAVEGFKVDAVDYLLKPFGLDDFKRAALRLQERLGHTTATQPVVAVTAPPSTDDTLFVKTDYKTIRIAIHDIRYVEGMSEYVKLYLEEQNKPIITLIAMKKLEERLPQNFMRIHRSYIVNLDKIQEVNKNKVVLDAETYLPVGDNYREVFNEYLQNKYIGK